MRFLLLLSLFAAGPALAARVEAPHAVDELTVEARQVVHARVLAAQTTRVGPKVQTTYTLGPIATLAGPAEVATFTVTLPGGQLGEVLVEVHGVPVWSTDDEVVVFRDDTGGVRLDGVLTVKDGAIVDALRDDRTLPATLPALDAAVREVVRRPGAPVRR